MPVFLNLIKEQIRSIGSLYHAQMHPCQVRTSVGLLLIAASDRRAHLCEAHQLREAFFSTGLVMYISCNISEHCDTEHCSGILFTGRRRPAESRLPALLTLSVWTGCAAKKSAARNEAFGERLSFEPRPSWDRPPINIENTSIINAEITQWRATLSRWKPTG